MLKVNLKDKKHVEKFSVQRGLTIFTDLNGEKQYHTEYFVNESINPIQRAGYEKFLNKQYHMSLMQEFIEYQNQLEALCFGENASENLSKIFEKLSGSINFKEQYETLKKEIL